MSKPQSFEALVEALNLLQPDWCTQHHFAGAPSAEFKTVAAAVPKLQGILIAIATGNGQAEIERSGLLARAETAETKLRLAEARVAELEAEDRASALGQQIAELSVARDQALAESARFSGLVDLLEGALQVKGVSTEHLVPSCAAPAPRTTAADYDRRLRKAGTPDERAAIMAEFELEVENGRVDLRDPSPGNAFGF